MFYAHFVLSKKGPLAKIWLAAHWDKKLTKAHVFETNIEGSVEAIIQPKAKLALRTSGHLLLGVVRIYSRKAKYLLADCNEAFVKIKMAFRPGMVDLPEENREAALSAITLPEAFHEFDTAMADLSELEVQTQFAVNQSRPEEITMREDLGSITLIGDDGFGDMGFDSGLLDDSQLEETLFAREPADFATLAMMAMKEKDAEKDDEAKDDGAVEESIYEGPAGADDDDYDSNDGGHFSPVGETELFADPVGGDGDHEIGGLFEDPVTHEDAPLIGQSDKQLEPVQPAPFLSPTREQPEQLQQSENPPFTTDPLMPQLDKEAPIVGQSSLTQPSATESETFTLKPIDIMVAGPERKYRKKRKLIVDEQKAIASETMKLQLSDTSDIVTTLDLAPPTKKLMHWKETGGVDKLTIMPGRPLVSKKLFKLFSSSLVAKQICEKTALDTSLKDSVLDKKGIQTEEKRSEEMEVRNTVGADGMPRLVFAVKKHSVPSTPIHEPSQQSSFKVPPSPSVQDPLHKNSIDSFSVNLDATRTTFDEVEPRNTSLDDSAKGHDALASPLLPSLETSKDQLQLYNTNDDDYDDDACAYNDANFDADDDGNEMEVDPQEQNDEEEEKQEEDEDAFDDPTTGDNEELTEEAEESRWNKKSQQMMHTFNRLLMKKDQVSLKEILSRCNRKQVASKFYSLLVLKKTQMVNVHQDKPYSDIIITRGPQFASMG